jgi:hypothetical protein
MVRKGTVFLLFAGGFLLAVSCMSGLCTTTSASQKDMPYRGIIIGTYWEDWPGWDEREFLEPKILFIGIVRHDGPMMTHYYRLEVHYIHRCYSLYVESFHGIQRPHFLFGFCRFYFTSQHTHMLRFTGEMHGFVRQRSESENQYDILLLWVNGTGLYFTSESGFFYHATSGFLHTGHLIELEEFNGTRTPLYLSGTGWFRYYYN